MRIAVALALCLAACAPAARPFPDEDASGDEDAARDAAPDVADEEPSPPPDAGIDAEPCRATAPAAYPAGSSCVPESPAVAGCPDAAPVVGWRFSCLDVDGGDAGPLPRMPPGVGACVEYNRFVAFSRPWTSVLCPRARCTVDADEAAQCHGRTPYACPGDTFDAGTPGLPPGCTRASMWGNGNAYGPVFCCP